MANTHEGLKVLSNAGAFSAVVVAATPPAVAGPSVDP